MNCLIVKMSSMGDVIHTLPALTDARRHHPEIRFDWLVEERFAEIPAWHPAVDRVMPVGFRRMGKQRGKGLFGGEIRDVWRRLRERRYRAVLDVQGLLKSALPARFARGISHGYDRASAREPLASFFYQAKHAVATDLHAVTRIRQFFAKALDYPEPTTPPDFGLGERFRQDAGKPTLIFFHATTWDTKHWPVTHWQDLAGLAREKGFDIRLSAGTAAEVARAETIAAGRTGVDVIPPGDLTTLAGIISGASGYVGSDTGLSHLCGALEIPGVTVYGPSDPGLTAPIGEIHRALNAALDCQPCKSRTCIVAPESGQEAPCQVAVTAETVWRELESIGV